MTILTLSMLAGILAAVATALKYVPEGHVYSLYRGGQPRRLLQPGLHWVVPVLDHVANRIDLAGQTLHFEETGADTPALHGTVYWQVLEPERADPLIGEAEQFIRDSVLAVLRAEGAQDVDNIRILGGRVKQQLNQDLRQRGMMVTRIDLAAAA